MSRSSTSNSISSGSEWNVFKDKKRGSAVSKASSLSRRTTVQDLAEHNDSLSSKRSEDDIIGNGSVSKERGVVTIALKATAVITCVIFSICFITGVFDAPVSTERMVRAPPASFFQPNAAKQHFPVWNQTELHGSMSFDIEKWIISSTRGDNVLTRHADIMDILSKSCDLLQRRIHLWLRAQPVAKGVRISGWALQNKPALMKSSDMVKFRVLTEFIKKSDPALHVKLTNWMDAVRPKQDRFYEVKHEKKPVSWKIFSDDDWEQITKDMLHMKHESRELFKIAKTLDPKGADVLTRIGKAFRHIHVTVPISEFEFEDRFKDIPFYATTEIIETDSAEDGSLGTLINYWEFLQKRIRNHEEKIRVEPRLHKKRKLLTKAKEKVKVTVELFVESEVRNRLSRALDQPELNSTIGDNLKAIREHPNLPKSIIKKIEEMFHLQFMVIGSKLRFMTWETLGASTGDMEW